MFPSSFRHSDFRHLLLIRHSIRKIVLHFHPHGISPHAFQVVELAGVLAEDVDDHVHKIHARPLRPMVARAREGPEVATGGHLLHLVAGGLHLPRAGPRGDHQKIRDRRDPRDIEHNDMIAARVGQQLCRVQRELPGGRQLLLLRLALRLLSGCDDSPPQT